ncbi:MAG TPA: hypothetical protein VF865_06445 [Acidobacteriaceae bacterium]
MTKASGSPATKRLVFGVICLTLFAAGLGDLLFGQHGSQTPSGLSALAPFAVVIGALGLAAAVWRSEFFVPVEKKLDWADIPIPLPPAPPTQPAAGEPTASQSDSTKPFDLNEFIRK